LGGNFQPEEKKIPHPQREKFPKSLSLPEKRKGPLKYIGLKFPRVKK